MEVSQLMIKKVLVTLIAVFAIAFTFNVSTISANTPTPQPITFTPENVYSNFWRIKSQNNAIALGTKVINIFIPFNANLVLERGAVLSTIELYEGNTVVDIIILEDYVNDAHGNFSFDLTKYNQAIDRFDIFITTSLTSAPSQGFMTFMNQNSYYLELLTVTTLRIHYVTDYFNTIDTILIDDKVYDWQMIAVPMPPAQPNQMWVLFEGYRYADGTVADIDALDFSRSVNGTLNIYAVYEGLYNIIYFYNLTQFYSVGYVLGTDIPRITNAIPTITPYIEDGYLYTCNTVEFYEQNGAVFDFRVLSDADFNPTFNIYIRPVCTRSATLPGDVIPPDGTQGFLEVLDNIGFNTPVGLFLIFFILSVIVTVGMTALLIPTMPILLVNIALTGLFMFMGFLPLIASLILLLLYTLILIYRIKGGGLLE